jgi:hypothetical protein
MNYTPEQIAEIVLKVLKEVNEPDILSLSLDEKYELAQNPNTLPETLKVLATDKDSSVRWSVAQNPNTPVETLKVLATDKNCEVRYWVAQNPNTLPETLKVLATDESPDVRWEVAVNPNYKTQTLELTQIQYDALKVLLKSSQDESLKTLTL